MFVCNHGRNQNQFMSLRNNLLNQGLLVYSGAYNHDLAHNPTIFLNRYRPSSSSIATNDTLVDIAQS